ARLRLRLGLQDDANNTLAGRGVGSGERIGIDDDDAADVALRAGGGKGHLRTAASQLGAQIAATIDTDRQFAHPVSTLVYRKNRRTDAPITRSAAMATVIARPVTNEPG